MADTEQKTFERKPKSFGGCIYHEQWWNDPEQRNCHIYQCNNKENTGGTISGGDVSDTHFSRTYSHLHKNTGMKYRCWGKSEKELECELVLSRTEPEVKCERFVVEEAHPKEARVLKEELRERFFEADSLCAVCQNCFDE